MPRFTQGLSMLGACAFAVLMAARAASAGADGQSPASAPGDAGKVLFERNCALCHGIDGTGGRGPNLARARLAHAPDDTALHEVIENGIPPEMPDGGFFSAEDIDDLVVFVRSLGQRPREALNGDPAHGANVFQRSGCPSCHIFAGQGTGFGPELTDLQDRRSPAYVRDAILNPAAHLPAEFLMVKAILPNGEVISGMRVNEDSFSVQIKDGTGQFHSFRKAELKGLQKLKGESPMPSFAGVLGESDLQDLVAYIETPRGGP